MEKTFQLRKGVIEMKKETSAQLLALDADTLVQVIDEALQDGIVTHEERRNIRHHAGILRLRAEGHVTRVTLGLRLINGGVCDREMQANVRSYGRWSEEERKNLDQLAPVEADERQAA